MLNLYNRFKDWKGKMIANESLRGAEHSYFGKVCSERGHAKDAAAYGEHIGVDDPKLAERYRALSYVADVYENPYSTEEQIKKAVNIENWANGYEY